MKRISLIANSSLQYYKFETEINLDFGKNNKIYFSGKEFKGILIYTGQIDELLSFKYGDLPYRTLRFEFETFKLEQFQELVIVMHWADWNSR